MTVYAKPPDVVGQLVTFGLSGACLLGGLATFAFIEADMALVMLVIGAIGALLMLGIGALVRSSTKVDSIVDGAQRRIQAKGQVLDYDDVIAVRLDSVIDFISQSTRHGTRLADLPAQRFQVSVVTAEIDEAGETEIRSALAERDQALANHDDGARGLARIAEATANRLRGAVPLLRCGEELLALQVAEVAAREFDVPLLDASGDGVIERSPRQLDQSLVDRLQLGVEAAEDPGPPPAGIEVADDGRTLRWKSTTKNAGPILLVFGLPGAVLLGADLAGSSWLLADPLVRAAAIASFVLFLLGSYLMAFARATLRIDDDQLHLAGTLRPRQRLAINAIEGVRARADVPPTYLAIFGDRDLLTRYTKTPDQARWLARAVRWKLKQLAGSAHDSASAYR